MKLLKLNKGVTIDIIHKDKAAECQTVAEVLASLSFFKTTKEQYFEDHEFIDYIRVKNAYDNNQLRYFHFPNVWMSLFLDDGYPYMKDYYLIKKDNYFALIRKENLELLA